MQGRFGRESQQSSTSLQLVLRKRMIRVVLLSLLSTSTIFAVSTSNLHDGLRESYSAVISIDISNINRRHSFPFLIPQNILLTCCICTECDASHNHPQTSSNQWVIYLKQVFLSPRHSKITSCSFLALPAHQNIPSQQQNIQIGSSLCSEWCTLCLPLSHLCINARRRCPIRSIYNA